MLIWRDFQDAPDKEISWFYLFLLSLSFSGPLLALLVWCLCLFALVLFLSFHLFLFLLFPIFCGVVSLFFCFFI